jgi:hypothetical protein
MNKKKNTPQRLSEQPRKINHRSSHESKLERRQFALPMEEQERILQKYRDKGLAYGKASHGSIKDNTQHYNEKSNNMEQDGKELPESKLKFISFGLPWDHGSTIEYVVADLPGGREAVVGRIDVYINETTKERSFQAFGSNGQELYGRRRSLYWLKRDFIRNDNGLYAQAIIDANKPREGGTAEQVIAALKDKTKSLGQSVPSPYAEETHRDITIKRIEKAQKNSKSKSRGR